MNSLKNHTSTLSKKVEQARIAAGFSISDAAKSLGFKNYQTLSEIEKGERKLNANELSSMAKLYKKNLDFFFESETPVITRPLWRKVAASAAPMEDVQSEFLFFLENYSNMETLLGLKRKWKGVQKKLESSDFSLNGFDLAGQLAEEFCSVQNLGSRPALNIYSVLENDLRFKILHLQLKAGASAASIVDSRLGVGILINVNDAPWRRHFDLAHELFHIITWDIFSFDEIGDGSIKTNPERYADIFASCLLLPERHLKNSFEEIKTGERIRIVDIIEVAKDFGVSTEAVLWRLVSLKTFKKETVTDLLNDKGFRDTDKRLRRDLYPDNQPGKFPSRYISLAYRCLMEGKISRGTFAQCLGIERSGIDEFLKEEGLMEKYYEKIAPS